MNQKERTMPETLTIEEQFAALRATIEARFDPQSKHTFTVLRQLGDTENFLNKYGRQRPS